MKSKAWEALRRSLDRVKEIPGKILDHIEKPGKIRQERNQRMQEELDIKMRPKEKDSNYITVEPKRSHAVMSVGRRIVK